ncbi:MAG: disulfide bond formation protein B [Betaproteobacteria bacterium]|nr:disulfide bond formation protein B [Betaproteobacteria bacterium]
MTSRAASARLWFALGALACAGLLAYALVLQYFQGQDPCPLCLVQRAFFTLFMAAFLVGALHNPGRTGSVVYAVLGLLAAAGGFAVAARQVWLQHLPKDQVPACGPDLYFMLQNFPLARTLEKLFTGTGECAEVKWRLLGLSIAEWSLAWFAALALYALWLAARAQRSRRT